MKVKISFETDRTLLPFTFGVDQAECTESILASKPNVLDECMRGY